MSFTDAASIPAVFCTAYYSLIKVARLQAGESILIQAAAGGVGQAAIMIAQMIGAEIYVTVGSEAKKEHLIATYGIPLNHISNSRTAAFGPEIRQLAHKRGVDVVLNSLGGELLRTTWDTLASYGRFVELGKIDIERNSRLDMATFSKSTTFASFDLEMLREDKPTVVHEMMLDIMEMYSRKKLKMITPINLLPIDALGSALNDMQRGKAMGKTVIEPLPGQEVQVSPNDRLEFEYTDTGGTQAMPAVTNHPSIRSDATYLITGGMGGLGRSMARWLVQQGATSIALLSRSGNTSATAKTMKDEYLSIGINISVLQCDVADEDQVRKVVEHCSKSMPPIRGIIHGAMVLHVRSPCPSHIPFLSHINPSAPANHRLATGQILRQHHHLRLLRHPRPQSPRRLEPPHSCSSPRLLCFPRLRGRHSRYPRPKRLRRHQHLPRRLRPLAASSEPSSKHPLLGCRRRSRIRCRAL